MSQWLTFGPSVAWADDGVLQAHDPITVATASAKASLLPYIIACSKEGSTLGSFHFPPIACALCRMRGVSNPSY